MILQSKLLTSGVFPKLSWSLIDGCCVEEACILRLGFFTVRVFAS